MRSAECDMALPGPLPGQDRAGKTALFQCGQGLLVARNRPEPASPTMWDQKR